MTGISDGREAKKSPGLQTKPNNISLPLLPPPPTPPQKEKQTNRQTKKQKEKNLFFNETTLTQKILG